MLLTSVDAFVQQSKIQQLMKDKKEALATAKEVTTKLENEKKVRTRVGHDVLSRYIPSLLLCQPVLGLRATFVRYAIH